MTYACAFFHLSEQVVNRTPNVTTIFSELAATTEATPSSASSSPSAAPARHHSQGWAEAEKLEAIPPGAWEACTVISNNFTAAVLLDFSGALSPLRAEFRGGGSRGECSVQVLENAFCNRCSFCLNFTRFGGCSCGCSTGQQFCHQCSYWHKKFCICYIFAYLIRKVQAPVAPPRCSLKVVRLHAGA